MSGMEKDKDPQAARLHHISLMLDGCGGADTTTPLYRTPC